MERDPQVLQSRLAHFLAPMSAKELARRVNCDPRTAENMKRGHWPIARHWLGLLATFGEDITEAVFHPEKAVQRLERETRELEEQLQQKRALLREVASFAPRSEEARPAVQDRTPDLGVRHRQ